MGDLLTYLVSLLHSVSMNSRDIISRDTVAKYAMGFEGSPSLKQTYFIIINLFNDVHIILIVIFYLFSPHSMYIYLRCVLSPHTASLTGLREKMQANLPI